MATTAIKPSGAAGSGPSSAEELVLGLRQTTRALQTLLTVQARANGLGLLDFMILTRAADGDGVVPSDIAAVFGLRSSTMTTLTNRLHRKRLIRRLPHPTDRRLVILTATAKGQRLLDRALGPVLSEFRDLASRLSRDERETIARFNAEVEAIVAPRTGIATTS